jgi:ABC-type lipoprotein release transport system permease subunit
MGVPFNSISRLAWRNLWRNYRRTIVMLLAIAIGTWGMIFTTAMLKGMMLGIVEDGIKALPGHVQVHHADFRDDPSVENSLPQPDAAFKESLDDPVVIAWGSRIKVPAMISSERDSRGVILLGIEPEKEIALGFDPAAIVEGRFIESPQDQGLVVGRKLLERLESRLGKRVVLMAQDPDNEIAERGLRIVGVFKATLPATEEGQVYMGLETAQKLLNIPDLVSEIAATGALYNQPEALVAHLRNAAPAGTETLDWRSLQVMLGESEKLVGGIVYLMTIVIFLALSFGLVNTFMMAVFERVREIGLMKALGMRPSSIVGQILLESMILLAIGVAVGNALAWLSIYPLRGGIDLSAWAEALAQGGMSSTLTPILDHADMVRATVVVILLGVLTSLLPALRASRLDPVRAINKT